MNFVDKFEDVVIVCLLVICLDQFGIISVVFMFLYNYGVNIIDLDQYFSDYQDGIFFLCLEFQISGLDCSYEVLENNFCNCVVNCYGMQWYISYVVDKKCMVVLVLCYDYVIMDLLWWVLWGDLLVVILMVISNYDDLCGEVECFGIFYYYILVIRDNKEEVEVQVLELLEG